MARPVTARRALDALFGVVALLVLLPMLGAALHDMSRAWDVGYYHLPFAARLGGIVGRDEYVFHRMNQARYDGFPLLGELLQGLCWKLTGRPETVNVPAFLSVPAFAWFLKRRYEVPLRLGIVGLLAIPLVHVHATSAYVDLPANVAAAVCVLLAIEVWSKTAAPSHGAIGLAITAAAISANIKFQTHPILVVALFAIGVRVVVAQRQGVAEAKWQALALFLSLPIVFGTPLRNLWVFHNPFYPVELRFFGHVLPGADTPYSSSPAWLEAAPRPIRFVASLLELRIRPFSSRRRWTVDQWMDDDDGSRVGGFFNAYVVALVVLLTIHVVRRSNERRVRAFGAGFAILTAVTSVLPQSHELRYYLVWMLVLVGLALSLAEWGEAQPSIALGGRLPRMASLLTSGRFVGCVALAALGVVLAVTRAGYAYPSGSTLAEIVVEEVGPQGVLGVGPGERVCTRREPWALLWAAPFHRPLRYVLKESQELGDCQGFRPLEP